MDSYKKLLNDFVDKELIIDGDTNINTLNNENRNFIKLNADKVLLN
jgi:hypothetical protein